MRSRHYRMPILRLAYTTQFLIALIAVFLVWSQVGGQGHLDIMPWYLKLALATAVALATVRATISAVSREPAWNGGTLKWLGIVLALSVACGLATYYYHLYGESDENDEGDGDSISLLQRAPELPQPDARATGLERSKWDAEKSRIS